jgi:hypothetical protein
LEAYHETTHPMASLFDHLISHPIESTEILGAHRDMVNTMEDVMAYYRDMYSLADPIIPSHALHPTSSSVPSAAPDALLSLFSPSMTYKAISGYPLGKSPGAESITPMIMRTLCPSPTLLLLIISHVSFGCVTYQTTPDRWNASLISSLFVSCSSSVVVNGHLSPPIHRERGLFQGSLLSPWLFNVFIDDLAASINCQSALPPYALLFADDIQLQARSYPHAQNMLDIVSHWLDSNGMKVNISNVLSYLLFLPLCL